jgi:hypothetical protein
MGGNALKNTETERKSLEEYLYISGYMLGALDRLFPRARLSLIKAYRTKESFGDLDMLIASDNLPPNWKQMVEEEFKPNEIFNNGNVMSFDYMKMQIDLITVPDRELRMASTYLAFNDLGNLMGRIAQKMGFKYGSDGLWKKMFYRDQKFAEIVVSQEPSDIFSFLGYDWARFVQGFETLEDIFEFASSTPFFHRNIYLLENRNNYSRTRDAKRPTYTAFLKWLEDKPELDRFQWKAFSLEEEEQALGEMGTPRWKQDREMVARAEKMFPELERQMDEAIKKHVRVLEVKRLFNGDIVNKLTGYQGKELGQFIAYCREQYTDFDNFILNNPDAVKDMIVMQKSRFEKRDQA